jgi:hypothetical protein
MYLLMKNEYKNVIVRKDSFRNDECLLPYFETDGSVSWLKIGNATKSYELIKIFANVIELKNWLKNCDLEIINGIFTTYGLTKQLANNLKEV